MFLEWLSEDRGWWLAPSELARGACVDGVWFDGLGMNQGFAGIDHGAEFPPSAGSGQAR